MSNSRRSLRWRHNGRDSVSNHQPHDCLLNRLFRRRSKKTSKFRATGLCAGNSPVAGEFPAQMASYAENVSIWWRHHVKKSSCKQKGHQLFEFSKQKAKNYVEVWSWVVWVLASWFDQAANGCLIILHCLPVWIPLTKGQQRGNVSIYDVIMKTAVFYRWSSKLCHDGNAARRPELCVAVSWENTSTWKWPWSLQVRVFQQMTKGGGVGV